MKKLKDKWVRWAGVPLLALLGQWTMYGYTNVPYPNDWKIPFFFVLGGVLVWEVNRIGIIRSRRKFPELAQTRQRVLFQLTWFIIGAFLVRVAQTYFYYVFTVWDYVDYTKAGPYLYNTLVAFAGTIQFAMIFEGIYLYKRWRVSYKETLELKKANLQSQLDSLKAQINPHFLFNSLNSISSLIQSDPAKAEEFIDELSSVYRYLLRENNRELCTLGEEIKFIRAYFSLLKTRHGDGINLNIDIPTPILCRLLPPLTLQLLFENAVKHNIVSASKPLIINIFAQGSLLYVENNLQKKRISVASNKVGLSNIMTKYELLNQPAVSVFQDEHKFQVTLPLIEPNFVYEPTQR
jgi:sensor histidine kinase YesM